MDRQLIKIHVKQQKMYCYQNDVLLNTYIISTAKNGLGETFNSECTPRGWHVIHSIIGLENEMNSVFVDRKWTGEIYNEKLARENPDRDWILSRVIQLDGLQVGFNKGGNVDTLEREIYIHGTADYCNLGLPNSHGCIRMRNLDIIKLANWVKLGSRVYISE